MAARLGGIGLEHPEQQEAGERREAEHEGGLLAGEVRCGAPEILDRLIAQVAREPFHAVRRPTHEAGDLRRIGCELVGGAADGLGDVAGEVGADGDLRIEKALGALGGFGRLDDAVCFAWLPACCATSVSFATASSAFARMPCEAGSAACAWLARADAGAELVERC